MKKLILHLLAIGCVSVALSSPAWAQSQPLTFGVVATGSITEALQTIPYTFAANANDVIDFTMDTTSGSLIPKLELFNSSGTPIASNYSGSPFGCSGSLVEMNTVLIPATGTYTLDVNDCSGTNTGDFALFAQRTNNPSNPASLYFGQEETGTISLETQNNAYTFGANANDVVDFTLVTTSGSLIPKILLYNPSGTLNSSNYSDSPFACSGSLVEMNTVTLPVAGTYAVFIRDCNDTATGSYSLYSQRTDNPGGTIVPLLFGQVQTGSITAETQNNTYTFTANANDVFDYTVLTTSGTLIPKILLYNPSGTLNSSNYSNSPFGCSGSLVEMNGVTLSVPGTYTVLIRDCNDSGTGNYSLYSQRLNNPSGAVVLPFAQPVTGLIGVATQNDTYVFAGNANEVVDFTLLTTNGNLIPKIILYNPSGTLNNSNYSDSPFGCSGSLVEMNGVALPVTGTYTLLIRDCSDVNTGNYALFFQSTNDPSGPIPIVWGDVQTGTVGSVVQSNAYTFSGTTKTTVDFTMLATSGNLIPKLILYNPDGSVAASNYSNSPFGCSGTTTSLSSVTLTQTGAYTLFVRDCSDVNTGNYSLSSQCFGTCVVTPAITWATPAPIPYLTPLGPTQLDATANVPGTPTYTPPKGTVLKPVGVYVLSMTFTPTDTTDYSIAEDNVQLTVVKATPVCNWPTPAPIVWGTPLSANQLDASCYVGGTLVPGMFVYSPPAGTVLSAGLQTLSLTFTPNDTIDFNGATAIVTLTVVEWQQLNGALSQISVGFDGTVWGLTSAGQISVFNPHTPAWQPVTGSLTQIAVGSSGCVWGLNAAGQIYRYDFTSQGWDQVPGILSKIAVGSDCDVWGLNSSSQIYHFNAATKTWGQIPGALAQLAVGYDGAVWGLNASGQVYRFNPGTQTWQQVAGTLTKIAVGADGDVWGINGGPTYHFNALSQQWESRGGSLVQIAVGSASNVWGLDAAGGVWSFASPTQTWNQVPGQLAQIAVGENGAVWGVNSAQQIYQFAQPTQTTQTFHLFSGPLAQVATGLDGNAWGIDASNQVWHFDAQLQSWQQVPGGLSEICVGFGGNVWGLNAGQIWQFDPSNQSWNQISGSLAQLACGADGSVWGLNSAGQIWRFNSSTQGFQQIAGSLAKIAVGADGTVWGINSAGQIFRFNPSTPGWDQIPGSLSQIAVGSANNVWGINAAGQIFRYDPQAPGAWDSIPGALTQIAVAFDGAVWGLNSAQQVWLFNAQTKSWDSIAGLLSQISVGADAVVWGVNVNANGQTYEYW
jgi:6-phosphogluconate dehydrogenase (decarboxylating)